MNEFNLEICVESAQSARIAEANGATRLELCGQLIIGGVTPSLGLMELVKEVVDIPVHALIRPRFGDFHYTTLEFEQMKRDLVACKRHMIDGVVIGALTAEGDLDVVGLKSLVPLCEGMHLTLHRAFDVCRDPFKTLEEAIELGFDTILTSGQAASAPEGLELLKKLTEVAAGRITIMPGAGINSGNLERIMKETGTSSVHLSAKQLETSPMNYKNPNVYMGLPGIDESVIFGTNGDEVAAAHTILKNL